MRLGLIGCGSWGRNHARVMSELGVLGAIHDADTECAATTANAFSVSSVPLAAMLDDETLSGVVIATPPVTHADLASKAIECGKHVLVEKPLALTLADGTALAAQAESADRILMVGRLLRYHPAYQRLRRDCAEGLVGKLQYIYSNRLHLGRFRIEENSLWSFAPHDISMILGLTGQEPGHVSAVGHHFLKGGIADVTVTNMAFADGVGAHVHVSWLHPFKEQRLVVVGEAGMIVFEDSRPWSEKLLLYPHRIDTSGVVPTAERAEPHSIDVAPGEPLVCELLHFVECITNGKRPITDAEEGLRVLRVLDAAQRSVDQGIAASSRNSLKN